MSRNTVAVGLTRRDLGRPPSSVAPTRASLSQPSCSHRPGFRTFDFLPSTSDRERRRVGLGRRDRTVPAKRTTDPGAAIPVAVVACEWHNHGMARTRLSTTVDRDLLDDARRTRAGGTDAELIDAALGALLAQYRAAAIDEAYAVAYADHPLDEPDEWGDLASFRQAAAR
jgi:hypothetical protein